MKVGAMSAKFAAEKYRKTHAPVVMGNFHPNNALEANLSGKTTKIKGGSS